MVGWGGGGEGAGGRGNEAVFSPPEGAKFTQAFVSRIKKNTHCSKKGKKKNVTSASQHRENTVSNHQGGQWGV